MLLPQNNLLLIDMLHSSPVSQDKLRKQYVKVAMFY